MKRLLTLVVGALLALPLAAQAPAKGTPQKVMRLAFPIAETGFDPARIVDLYSRTITPHIFEGLYEYDHLARPSKIRPLTAVAMPEASDGYRTWTVKVQPGIYFATDLAFKGVRRELVAQDYVYSFKRIVDPANVSPVVAGMLDNGILGLKDLRDAALKDKKPFDYDKEIEGLRALDRYTLQFKLEKPRPRFVETLATSDLFGAVAREVVEHYGDAIPGHPVGTGPFKLTQWRRSSLIVLERNPEFRDRFYDFEPAADDAEGQALLKKYAGRKLPLIDRVEVSIIEETQPRWLAFLNGQIDQINVPSEFVSLAMPNGKIAPNLAKQGVRGYRTLNSDVTMTLFNMDDPVVGGYTPEKVALRRAISLAVDVEREIQLIRRGQGIVSQSPLMPHTTGYDRNFKSVNGDFDVARANALLDMYGYVDKDGDGFRDLPDGSPLVLRFATQPDQTSRQMNELWTKYMEPIRIRLTFVPAKWPENLKAVRAGKLQVWSLGSSAAAPDGQGSLARLYGPQSGSQNLARFKNAEFDALYEKMLTLPDGPERLALFDRAKIIAIAYAPYKTHVHRFNNDLVQPRLVGYRRPLFWQEWWHRIDIDDTVRAP